MKTVFLRNQTSDSQSFFTNNRASKCHILSPQTDKSFRQINPPFSVRFSKVQAFCARYVQTNITNVWTKSYSRDLRLRYVVQSTSNFFSLNSDWLNSKPYIVFVRSTSFGQVLHTNASSSTLSGTCLVFLFESVRAVC